VILILAGSVPNAFRAALVNIGDLTAYDLTKHALVNKALMKASVAQL
jgi:hypothetical protein